MVIDTSVLIALLFHEPEWRELATTIELDPIRLVSAASALEAHIVTLARLGHDGCDDLELLQKKLEVEIRPVELEQLKFAKLAYARFGKGRHGAALNFGDCFSYSLSFSTGQPLLFKGNDFSQTDVAQVDW
jgi:ribonuclease VapC